MAVSPVGEIIEELSQGHMVVLMDDEDRENEGDLVMAAEFVRPDDVNFMARHGRGLICLTLTEARCKQLQLPLMVSNTQKQRSTNFTLSIEATVGVTTGISAADRATTVQAAVRQNAGPGDIVQPGHIFPLMAQRGGVLSRAGHTEAGVDLARIAGLEPASLICEIMNEDGTMARMPELLEFAKTHKLKIGTIADLIHYRMENEATVKPAGKYNVNTECGEFTIRAYHDTITDATHLALIKGKINKKTPTLVRVHVQETLLDVFTDNHRSGSWTAHQAMAMVAREGAGVIVLLDQTDSPKSITNILEKFSSEDTVSELPNLAHSRAGLRTYGVGSQILADIGVGKMRVMGHAIRLPGMSGFGLEVVENIESSNIACDEDKNKSKQAG
ncbi:MAG: bifunctional 3,4-dihydroxy-2-butanone-4-phosphate synthase/GTP cyclohydrolase II [Acidiferrobacterales bacterium]